MRDAHFVTLNIHSRGFGREDKVACAHILGGGCHAQRTLCSIISTHYGHEEAASRGRGDLLEGKRVMIRLEYVNVINEISIL